MAWNAEDKRVRSGSLDAKACMDSELLGASPGSINLDVDFVESLCNDKQAQLRVCGMCTETGLSRSAGKTGQCSSYWDLMYPSAGSRNFMYCHELELLTSSLRQQSAARHCAAVHGWQMPFARSHQMHA